MAELKKEVIGVEFTKSKDFRTIAATGAWGGPNPQGEIVCSFYVERQQFPEGEDKTQAQKLKMLREMQVSVIMRPDIAKSIGEWLVKNANSVLPEISKTAN